MKQPTPSDPVKDRGCSSFCHEEEPCFITATGRCDTIRELMDDIRETSRQLEITTGRLAKARVMLDEMKSALQDPVRTHAMMLRGDIAYTPEHLRHIIGDSLHNSEPSQPITPAHQNQ